MEKVDLIAMKSCNEYIIAYRGLRTAEAIDPKTCSQCSHGFVVIEQYIIFRPSACHSSYNIAYIAKHSNDKGIYSLLSDQS